MGDEGAVRRVRSRLAEIAADIRGALPRALLETVAVRFDAARPDAPADDLAAFLELKGWDWQEFHERLAELDPGAKAAQRIRSAAEAALARGDFAATESRLAELDEALAADADRASLRAARAAARLLKGDADGAADDIEAAASLLEPTDAAEQRHAGAQGLFNEGCHAGGTGALRAIDLLRRNEAIRTREADPEGWLETQLCLGLALDHEGSVTDGPAGDALLDAAIATHRATLEAFTREARPADWAMAQFSVGYALLARAERNADAALVDEAVAAFRAARGIAASDRPEDWGSLQFDHGKAILNRARATPGPEAGAFFTEASEAFRAALASPGAGSIGWASAQSNLGLALTGAAESADDAQAASLLAEAGAAFRRALEIFAEEGRQESWAHTQFGLGRALGEQAARANAPDLFQEAIAAYRAATQVHTETTYPAEWGRAQGELGLVFEAMGDRDIGANGLAYRQAHAALDAAHATFLAAGLDDDVEICLLNLARVASKLGSAEAGRAP